MKVDRLYQSLSRQQEAHALMAKFKKSCNAGFLMKVWTEP